MEGRLLMTVLRLVHILGGIFWLGATLVTAGFLVPAMRATGGEGTQFMSHVMQERRMQMYLSIAMVLTILSGLAMFGYLSSAGSGVWARSRMGTVLSVGAVLAIVASAAGSMVARPASRKLSVVAQRMQTARSGGAAPIPADVAEMQALQARIARTLSLVATLLVLSAATMAIARYA
jgi:uncharacterized membrane protein